MTLLLTTLKENYERTWYLQWFFPRKLGHLLMQYDPSNPPPLSLALDIYKAYVTPLTFFQRLFFPWLADPLLTRQAKTLLDETKDQGLLTGSHASAIFNLAIQRDKPSVVFSAFRCLQNANLLTESNRETVIQSILSNDEAIVNEVLQQATDLSLFAGAESQAEFDTIFNHPNLSLLKYARATEEIIPEANAKKQQLLSALSEFKRTHPLDTDTLYDFIAQINDESLISQKGFFQNSKKQHKKPCPDNDIPQENNKNRLQ
jgi:hypothetical protein